MLDVVKGETDHDHARKLRTVAAGLRMVRFGSLLGAVATFGMFAMQVAILATNRINLFGCGGSPPQDPVLSALNTAILAASIACMSLFALSWALQYLGIRQCRALPKALANARSLRIALALETAAIILLILANTVVGTAWFQTGHEWKCNQTAWFINNVLGALFGFGFVSLMRMAALPFVFSWFLGALARHVDRADLAKRAVRISIYGVLGILSFLVLYPALVVAPIVALTHQRLLQRTSLAVLARADELEASAADS